MNRKEQQHRLLTRMESTEQRRLGENETNNERISGTPNTTPYVKDGINNYVVAGNRTAVDPEKTGTKSAGYFKLTVGAQKTATVRLRLSDLAPSGDFHPFRGFADILETRQREAYEFYKSITPSRVSEAQSRVMRQALAGMLWSKHYFFYDVGKWLTEHGEDSVKPGSHSPRNSE